MAFPGSRLCQGGSAAQQPLSKPWSISMMPSWPWLSQHLGRAGFSSSNQASVTQCMHVPGRCPVPRLWGLHMLESPGLSTEAGATISCPHIALRGEGKPSGTSTPAQLGLGFPRTPGCVTARPQGQSPTPAVARRSCPRVPLQPGSAVTRRHTRKPVRPAAACEHGARARLQVRGAFLCAARRGGTEPGGGRRVLGMFPSSPSSRRPAQPGSDPLREQGTRATGQSP